MRQHFIVDNCAMAGRSSKTFLEEGRLEDIKRHLKEGDYLLIQFGHNDASASRAERYIMPMEQFWRYAGIPYVRAARTVRRCRFFCLPSACIRAERNEEGERRGDCRGASAIRRGNEEAGGERRHSLH